MHRSRVLVPLVLLLLLPAACSSEVSGSARPAASAVVSSGAPAESLPDESTAAAPDATADGPIDGPIPRPTPGGEGAGVIPVGLEEFYTQQLDWQSCVPFNSDADSAQTYAEPNIECANLIVPLDYADPAGPTVSLAILRSAATGSDRLGALQIDPGGPGASGIDYVAYLSGAEEAATLHESFDFVGFDTRGVNASRPAVQCLTDSEMDASRARNLRTNTPAGIAALNDETLDYVQSCVQRTGRDEDLDGAAFLTTLGSNITVLDMDVLRSALGEEQLSYLGFSYGTLLGSLYAEQFPANVRAMVLDGAVDPAADSLDTLLGQATGFQGSFDAFAAWCAQQQSCPLGADPAGATQNFQALTRPLLDTPLPLTDGRTLTFDDALTGVQQALYYESLWETLRTALSAFANGDGFSLMALADFYLGRNSEGHYSNQGDAFNAVLCMDTARSDPELQDLSNLQKLSAAAPFRDSGDPVVVTASGCDTWPGQPTLDAELTVRPDLPTLVVISTTGDPATPYAAGETLAEDLGAALITVDGDTHTAYLSSGLSCVDDATTDYLVDLTIPADGLVCR